jgi:hypothetical protein
MVLLRDHLMTTSTLGGNAAMETVRLNVSEYEFNKFPSTIIPLTENASQLVMECCLWTGINFIDMLRLRYLFSHLIDLNTIGLSDVCPEYFP